MRYADITKPQRIETEPTDGLWFRHESPYDLSVLHPLTYVELRDKRPEYDVDARIDTEQQYHKMLRQDADTSFLYATVVGYNKMENPIDYPGFTYYFQLTDAQIGRCVFDVVDKSKWMDPTVGKIGLDAAKKIWASHTSSFESYYDPDVGMIDPRIEVIIPFEVVPRLVVPQEEDRN